MSAVDVTVSTHDAVPARRDRASSAGRHRVLISNEEVPDDGDALLVAELMPPQGSRVGCAAELLDIVGPVKFTRGPVSAST